MVTLLENPLRVGLRKERVPEPQILVIFGASGDLTQQLAEMTANYHGVLARLTALEKGK